ncbi:hypothetical protein [Streptomyces niveiscabiei]|uniref:Uncharacterized protein n=1 Tax=Streptomyces niveiscabiei TaxID=164115 RepID=A0ABW9HVD2_9ACTN
MRTTALFAALSLAAFVLTELREPDQYKAGTVDLVLPEELGKALTRDAGLAEPDRLVAFVRAGALRHSGGDRGTTRRSSPYGWCPRGERGPAGGRGFAALGLPFGGVAVTVLT